MTETSDQARIPERVAVSHLSMTGDLTFHHLSENKFPARVYARAGLDRNRPMHDPGTCVRPVSAVAKFVQLAMREMQINQSR